MDEARRCTEPCLIKDLLKFRLKKAQGQNDWIKAVKKALERDNYEDFHMLFKDTVNEHLVVPSVLGRKNYEKSSRTRSFCYKQNTRISKKVLLYPKLS